MFYKAVGSIMNVGGSYCNIQGKLVLQNFSRNFSAFTTCWVTNTKSDSAENYPQNNRCILQTACFHKSAETCAKNKVPWEYVRVKRPPQVFETGDKEGLKSIDLNTIDYKFRGCKELENADENVKKIFSLKFANRRTVHYEIKWNYIRKVQKHKLDIGSLEAEIAAMTIKIRHLQVHAKEQVKDTKALVTLKKTIDHRNKFLRVLRNKDIHRFEWILKELNMVFKPHPIPNFQVTRKGWLRQMTQNYCEKIRIARITAFKEMLQAKQADFLKERDEKLKFIADEVKALNLTPEELSSVQYEDTGVSKPQPAPMASSLEEISLLTEGLTESPVYYKRKPN